jgi:hypothetical protein
LRDAERKLGSNEEVHMTIDELALLKDTFYHE